MSENTVELKSNWQVPGGNELNNAVVVCSSKQPNYDNKIPSSDEIIDLNRTVLLQNQNNSNVCELYISLLTNASVTAFNLVTSGSRIIEVFVGNEEEYYGTFHGKYIDDLDEIVVHRYDVQIKRPNTKKIIIKFLNLEINLWIYGFKLYLHEMDVHDTLNTNCINFKNVETILSNSNYKLSDNAEKCKKFIEYYMFNKNNAPPNKKMLLSVINSNVEKEFSNLNLNTNLENMKSNENNKNINNHELLNNSNYNNQIQLNELNELKEYIDKKFENLQIFINEKLNRFEEQQNEKFNKILKLLQTEKHS